MELNLNNDLVMVRERTIFAYIFAFAKLTRLVSFFGLLSYVLYIVAYVGVKIYQDNNSFTLWMENNIDLVLWASLLLFISLLTLIFESNASAWLLLVTFPAILAIGLYYASGSFTNPTYLPMIAITFMVSRWVMKFTRNKRFTNKARKLAKI